ncbi:MAG: DUF1631 family protein [Pseudomonadota bacterium]
MSKNRPSLPSYIRLPYGLRFAGSASLAVVEQAADSSLYFAPKQAISPLPPEGVPVSLTIAGVDGDDNSQVIVEGTISSINSREVVIGPDESLPQEVVDALDPANQSTTDSGTASAPANGEALLKEMRQSGREQLLRALRRFLVDLGDHLFDLSTSSRYAGAGKHTHYDALNTLKRHNDEVMEVFSEHLMSSLDERKKEASSSSVDLEAASARNLGLVDLEVMDEKLAVEKLVSTLIDQHRVQLECLTIRAAVAAGIEPSEAGTPFHPKHILQAFTESLHSITDSVDVVKDILQFFRKSYAPILDSLYPSLNQIFVIAGIEPELEDAILEQGSILHPASKPGARPRSAPPPEEPTEEESATEVDEASNDDYSEDRRWDGSERRGIGGGYDGDRRSSRPTQPPMRYSNPQLVSRDRHDSMYDAVVNALNTSRSAIDGAESASDSAETDTGADVTAGSASTTDISTPMPESPAAGDGANAGIDLEPAHQQQLLSSLRDLQKQRLQPNQSLGDLEPLEELLRSELGEEAENAMGSAGSNRLGFVDNVFQTLHNNFDVSQDMAPSLARLRVPLARLSIREPRFFTQPEHPAHQLLNKISVLASADGTQNRILLNKVSEIVDEVADNYDDDPTVFDDAQTRLDSLLQQQDRVYNRNIERVVSGLEGQQRLIRAQRRVEQMLSERLDSEDAPKPLLDLLDGGWRSSLVQLALREDEDGVAWKEEAALLDSLIGKFRNRKDQALSEEEIDEIQTRLRALNKRLQTSNPGSVSHEQALRRVQAMLTGRIPLATSAYQTPLGYPSTPDKNRVEQLPRLRRWLQRVTDLEPGTRLRYRDKQGNRRQMKLIWVSEEKDRFAFVNERGQKIAELSAIQLARQLSRGAQSRSPVEDMSVLDQSMYETLERAQRTLSFDRNRDQLTKLINGDSLMYQLQRSLRHAQARGTEHAFMLIDIDNFQLVNEVFDRTSGDQVLSEFAQLLGQLNDRRALTARMKEDEFGVLLTYRSIEEAKVLANKIREDIAASSLTIGSEAVSFTVSIGIAAVVQASESPETVAKQARKALDLAKTQGRDQVVVFNVDQDEVLSFMRDRDASRSRLEEAMSTDRLVLRAQPIVQSAVDGSEGASHHYEILLAIREDDGSLNSPQEFIQSAERFGYVTLVDRWVVRETFSWISELMDSQKEVPELSINLSGTSITDNDFLDYVLDEISEYGVGTSKLCFEITETGAIDHLPRAADFVRTLRNIGCKFSLDDFGTGLASHKYLKELPVDYVKIDGTFITEVHQNRTDYAMAKSISDLAHFLGQKTIAECVESLDIVPALREIGIDYLQGWGVGLPRTLDEITEELANIET